MAINSKKNNNNNKNTHVHKHPKVWAYFEQHNYYLGITYTVLINYWSISMFTSKVVYTL